MTRDSDLASHYAADAATEFAPCANYDPDGDCIEFFASNEDFDGQRLDDWVTVYRGIHSGEIVGSQIKSVRKLLARYPGLEIEVEDGQVRLSHILRAPAFSEGDAVKLRQYQLLIGKVADLKVELPAAA